jgi:microcin C transport system permease protein
MIERFISNDLSLRRWRSFKSQRRSVIAGVAFLICFFFSATAELWSNSKPFVIHYNGKTHFPIFSRIHPSNFGQDTAALTDYRAIELGKGDWDLWPLIEWDPYESNKEVFSYPSPPSRDNLLGTDNQGRDVLARILYGMRYGVAYAFATWALTCLIGICLGGAMGFFGGKIDLIGQRVEEVISSIPTLFILIILVSIFKPSLPILVVISAAFGWILFSTYIRAEFLKNRKRDFVEVARAMGASNSRLIFKHILPNSLIPIITLSPFVIAAYITGLASLDYLGLGLPPPTPSWGELLDQAKQYVTIAWWLAVYPASALFLSLILLSLVGDGLRVAFDPRKS